MSERIPEQDWRWFGKPGHLIVGEWCRFHLCTQIGVYLVSTVGEYIPPHKSKNEREESEYRETHPFGEEIGADRLYETMVFKIDGYCDNSECGCGQPMIEPSELDTAAYNDRGSANEGHLAMCQKWADPATRPELEPEL